MMQATVKVLFVLCDDKITRWIPQGDDLTVETVNGLESIPYTGDSFWQEWRDENQLVDEDVIDALLLSDKVDGFGMLPEWVKKKGDSTWTLEDLVPLIKKPQFSNTSLLLAQGKARVRLLIGDGVKKMTLFVLSTLSYCLPSQGSCDAILNETMASAVATQPESTVKKPTILADFLVDDKSRTIEPGSSIVGSVRAFSQFRGCFVETSAAGDQMRIQPLEYDKIDGLKEKLMATGTELSFRVVSVSEKDGLIMVELEL